MSIYDNTYTDRFGQVFNLNDFSQKTILIVNVASYCGFTKQYEQIQGLYQDNSEKLEVIAFPCNQFGEQEPGNDEEIENFCKSNHHVTFRLSRKIEVNGPKQDPLYKELKSLAKDNHDIDWNFEKFIIKNGEVFHYPSDFIISENEI